MPLSEMFEKMVPAIPSEMRRTRIVGKRRLPFLRLLLLLLPGPKVAAWNTITSSATCTVSSWWTTSEISTRIRTAPPATGWLSRTPSVPQRRVSSAHFAILEYQNLSIDDSEQQEIRRFWGSDILKCSVWRTRISFNRTKYQFNIRAIKKSTFKGRKLENNFFIDKCSFKYWGISYLV